MSRRSAKRRFEVAQALDAQRVADVDTGAEEAALPLPLPLAGAQVMASVQDDEDGLARAFDLMNIAQGMLVSEQVALKAIEEDSTDEAEQALASAQTLRNARELALLDSRRMSLEAGTATLRPPSAQDLVQAQQLAAALAQVLSANARVAAIIGLTADIVRLSERLTA